MTPEAQRIAIATAFPGVFVRPVGAHGWNYRNSTVDRVLPCIDGDPLKDLNAVHEAEKLLSYEQWTTYVNHLCDFGVEDLGKPHKGFTAVHATAARRCEALLRTLGKWSDA